MKQEDLNKYFEQADKQEKTPFPPPSDEEIAELRELMAEMDGHLTEEIMLNLRVQVERVIAWEDPHAS